MARSDEVFESSIVPGLASAGLYFTSIDDLDATEKARILGVFEKEIFPVLTPLAVDPAIRSPTSRTCRSTWRCLSRIPALASSGSRG